MSATKFPGYGQFTELPLEEEEEILTLITTPLPTAIEIPKNICQMSATHF